MNEGWITDRLPTLNDVGYDGRVWATGPAGDCVFKYHWESVQPGQPWQPITVPAPYVKPKRWTVQFNHGPESFILLSHGTQPQIIPWLNEDHADAAQRICDIYNEVLP